MRSFYFIQQYQVCILISPVKVFDRSQVKARIQFLRNNSKTQYFSTSEIIHKKIVCQIPVLRSTFQSCLRALRQSVDNQQGCSAVWGIAYRFEKEVHYCFLVHWVP